MKIAFTLLIIISSVVCFANDTLNILFVGNSQTTSGAGPELFAEIATSLGKKVNVKRYSPGNTGFVTYIVDDSFYSHIKKGIWNYVVLQPSSGEAYTGVDLNIALNLRDSIYKYNTCDVKIIYYEVPRSPDSYDTTNFTSYNVEQDRIIKNIKELSDNTNIPIAPVGQAIRAFYVKEKKPFFWISDQDSHINDNGGYMGACIFYTTIFEESCEATTVTGFVEPVMADKMQSTAAEIVLTRKEEWRIGVDKFPKAEFKYSHLNYNFKFSTFQTNERYYWDFGNGITSIKPDPEVKLNFDFQDSYKIKLKTTIGCEADVQQLEIKKTDLKNFKFEAAPNPADEVLKISHNFAAPFLIFYNLNGQIVKQLQLNDPVVNIDVKNLATGVYIIKLQDQEQVIVHKIVVN